MYTFIKNLNIKIENMSNKKLSIQYSFGEELLLYTSASQPETILSSIKNNFNISKIREFTLNLLPS